MAEKRAQASGLWSSAGTWVGGVPAVGDDVYANNFTVYIDTPIYVNSLNTKAGTTAVAGGRFYNTGNTTISANIIYPGTTNCLTLTGSTTHTLTASQVIKGSDTTASVGGLYMAGSITIGQPTVTLVGNASGGSFTSQNWAIQLEGGNLTMTGSVYGGTGTNSDGMNVGTNVSYSTVLVLSGGPVVSGTGNGCRGIIINYSPTGTALTNSSCTLNCNLSGSATSTGSNIGALFSNTSIPIAINGNIHGATGGSTSSYGLYYAGGANTTTIVGNLNFPGAPVATAAVVINTAGILTINIRGNVYSPAGGGATNIPGMSYATASTSVVSITGTVVGGSGTNTSGHGLAGSPNGSGTITITGNVSGGSAGTNYGAQNNSTGTLIIYGDAVGGSQSSCLGVNNNSTGTTIISGTAVGGTGSGAHGAQNSSSGVITVKRAKANNWGVGSSSAGTSNGVLNNIQTSICYVEELEFGPNGLAPVAGPGFKILDKSTNVMLIPISTSGTKTLVDASTTNVLPPVSSVRSGVSYGSSSVGTLAVPSASNVSYGVAVDNTTGTAVLSPDAIWQTNNNTLTATSLSGTIGYRLRNVATAEIVGQQIAAYNT
jgi:hypothetical protein